MFIVFTFFSVLQRRISFAKLPPFMSKRTPALFPARRSAPCTDPEGTAPVAPAGLFTVYFDYKIALFFVKEVVACCGTGILDCYESGTAKRFSLALQFLQGEASCSERAFASLSG